jgi:Ca2+-binding RTX toxin-like protein
MIGMGGNDRIFGGAGVDTAFGGPGTDTVEGGDGNDNLFGNFQSDVLLGGPGDDFINGDNPNLEPGVEPPPGGPTETPGARDGCFGGSGFNIIVNCESGDPNSPPPPEV